MTMTDVVHPHPHPAASPEGDMAQLAAELDDENDDISVPSSVDDAKIMQLEAELEATRQEGSIVKEAME